MRNSSSWHLTALTLGVFGAFVVFTPKSAAAIQKTQPTPETIADKVTGYLAGSTFWNAEDPGVQEEVRELEDSPNCPADTVSGTEEVAEVVDLPPGASWEEDAVREGCREYIEDQICP